MTVVKLQDLISKLCNNGDYVTARSYIEANWEYILKEGSYLQFGKEALGLYQIIKKEKDNPSTLTRLQLHTISATNKACENFDISTLRLLLRNSSAVLHEDIVYDQLTPTAKSVLEAQGFRKGELHMDTKKRPTRRVGR